MNATHNKTPVAILGATGMVGQQLISLLADHPWFEIVALAASERSAGKSYQEAVEGRWAQEQPIPGSIGNLTVLDLTIDRDTVCRDASLAFCAIEADKDFIRALEESYADAGLAVVSNNSAHRWTEDIPMLMPEINPHHLEMIPIQRRSREWDTGLIVVKPNCSIQSYVPLLHAWRAFEPQQVIISTYQAISGASKTFASWPEMLDNVIPYIGGEEEKSENEPHKIWASIEQGQFVNSELPRISASCVRVAAANGHLATIHLQFGKPVNKEELINALREFENPLRELNLPSAPDPFITYFDEPDRPQTRLDRDLANGMGISAGRLREDSVLGWKCVALSHNTRRGAAGGSVLNAELLVAKGYVKR